MDWFLPLRAVVKKRWKSGVVEYAGISSEFPDCDTLNRNPSPMKGASMNERARVSRHQLSELLRSRGLWSEQTDAAFDLVEQVHSRQRRVGGGPYLEEHVYPVTSTVADYLSADENERAAETVLIALLHDTVEDSETIDVDSVHQRFGQTVANGVAALTKPEKRAGNSAKDSEQAEERYVAGVSAADWNVRVIKVFDRLNNLAAVHERPPERRKTYLQETRAHYLDLAKSVDSALTDRMAALLHEQELRFEQEFGHQPK